VRSAVLRWPLGCQQQRIPDWVVFDKPVQGLVFGCSYRRIVWKFRESARGFFTESGT
jgi:hypothetical protein